MCGCMNHIKYFLSQLMSGAHKKCIHLDTDTTHKHTHTHIQNPAKNSHYSLLEASVSESDQRECVKSR